MSIPPLYWKWDGEAAVPLRPKLADHHLVIGETYCFVEHQERSKKSHDAFFAQVEEGWRQLPENLAAEFATPDHLRKRLLISAGWYDETLIDAGSHAAAVRVAAAMRSLDDFAATAVRGPIVVHRRAKSQRYAAMDRKAFQASKDAALAELETLIGSGAGSLRQNVGKAA